MRRLAYIRIFLLAISLSGIVFQGEARHIIGGEIIYECLGNGTYRFVMKMYRDCRPQQNAADYDPMAVITIYRGDRAPYARVTSFNVNLGRVDVIAPPDYPCLILPPNLCVQEGIYEFEYTFPQWPALESYHIVYQRCCRNNTISNVITPGMIGATFTVEITARSQKLCNNSPEFKLFPPTVICVNNPINFDHSAIDSDGDSLVYSFCNPLKGGGLQGGPDNPFGNPNNCEGIIPNPACPPPFQNVAFQPPYSSAQPMGGSPIVSIDSETGLIEGVPLVKGQFVVGVCVREYRRDTLIGELRRDFQFNVADCDPTVFAKIKHDSKIGDRDFVVNSCGQNTVLFENESELEQYISSYRWEFDVGNGKISVTTKDAQVTFPGEGEYRGVMMVNPGTDCGDTAEIHVNLYPDIEAAFEFDYDTCIGGTTQFRDLSYTGSGQFTSWEWDFGRTGTSAIPSPGHTFPVPGRHPVQLKVTDINECRDSLTQIINYFPVPPLLIIDPSTFVGCNPSSVFFNNLSVPIDSTYDIRWDFGDGHTGSRVSPTHVYESPGVYSVSLEVTSPIGCFTSAFFPDWIEIKESPQAAFSYSPDEPSNFNPQVFFTDESFNAVSRTWLFDRFARSAEPNPSFTFPDTGVYQVGLIAIHQNGCTDTVVQLIDILPQVTYHMPNAFTPNGDGNNEMFMGRGFVAGMQNFEMTIWNRWGEMLYRTNDPESGWNGSKNNSGEVLPNGVYVYVVHYLTPRGDPIRLEGFATLVK